MPDVEFACTCGELHGVFRDAAPSACCHLVCYCQDCRAFARHVGHLDRLEPGGGTPLVQVLPSRIEIVAGQDRIACLRLSPKGLFRWYAACCDTPLANTVGTSRVPLAGMWRPLFGDPAIFGPVVTLGFTKSALPGGPKRDKGLARMLGGLMRRGLEAYLDGTARRSPFFDAAGAPVVAPVVIGAKARAAAYRE